MKLSIDLHTHTIASGHAYSTLRENIAAARARGIRILGTSDHAMAMAGVENNAVFDNYQAVPRVLDGVVILCGVEANILSADGAIDIDLDHKKLDYAIVSLHRQCFQPADVKTNTDAIINAGRHPLVKIIGHPDDARFPLDYERLSDFIVEEDLFCELNNSSLKKNGPRIGAEENLRVLLGLGKEKNMKVIVGSDAHMDVDVGNFELAKVLINELDYPEELIVNTWENDRILNAFTLMDK